MQRILVLAHRAELIYQAVQHAKNAGLTAGVEMGSERVTNEEVVVSSIQTQCAWRKCRDCRGEGCDFCSDSGKTRRMTRFRPEQFGLVIVDEGHHATAETYRIVLEYYRQNPNLRVLMVTATPKRSDGTGLHNVCDSVAYELGLRDAIQDGWLCPIRQRFVEVDNLSLAEVGTKAGGDLADGELQRAWQGETDEEEQRLLHSVARPTIELASGQPALVFASGVEHAKKLTAAFNAYDGITAELVIQNTPKHERRDIVSRYKRGATQVLVNVGCFCLDEHTEILTTAGWVGIDDITYSHEVANWDHGEMFFSQPRFIIKRERFVDEHMVSALGRMVDIRVTDKHRMLYKTAPNSGFSIAHASKLVGRKIFVPVSGVAKPLTVAPEQPNVPDRKTAIRSNSYVLRKGGRSVLEARSEAARRFDERYSLRHKLPTELSIDDCRFIGFWLGDGTRADLSSGGVEYSISQATKYSEIINWFDAVINRCGIDVRRRVDNARGVVRWSFCRGTGFGRQKRRGLFPIEPYLDKRGTKLWWGMDCDQFDAFIHGLSLADGDHGNSCRIPDSYRITGMRDHLDFIQAIAATRGYWSSLCKAGGCYRLALRKTLQRQIVNERLEAEHIWQPERVWCVTSDTGNIVTRRHGKVVVTGNTEGFDAPGTVVVANARPTKSESLYLQMIGRGTRPLPGVVDGPETAEERRAAIAASDKPVCLVLDFVGDSGRHKIVSVGDVLAGEDVEPIDLETALTAARKADEPVDVEELIERAKQSREAAAARRRQELEEMRASHRAQQAEYTATDVDLFAGGNFNPFTDYRPSPSGATPKQVDYLIKLGVDPKRATEMSRGQAGKVITRMRNRSGSDYIVTFGKHKGKALKDIPKGYLTWALSNIQKPDLQKNIRIALGQAAQPEPVDAPF